MADEQVPSRPQPLPAKASQAVQDGRSATAPLAPGPKGGAGKGQGKGEGPPPHVPLASRLLNLGAQVAFGLAVGVVVLLLMWASGMQGSAALGAAVVVAVVTTTFARSFVHWPLPKGALA